MPARGPHPACRPPCSHPGKKRAGTGEGESDWGVVLLNGERDGADIFCLLPRVAWEKVADRPDEGSYLVRLLTLNQIPFADLVVSLLIGLGVNPGTGSNLKRATNPDKIIAASCWAKEAPRQTRGPLLNGT